MCIAYSSRTSLLFCLLGKDDGVDTRLVLEI
jgi:hypothetical protein